MSTLQNIILRQKIFLKTQKKFRILSGNIESKSIIECKKSVSYRFTRISFMQGSHRCSFLYVCVAEEPHQLLKIFTVFLLLRQRLLAHQIYILRALSFHVAVLGNPKASKLVMQEFCLNLCYPCVGIFREHQLQDY